MRREVREMKVIKVLGVICALVMSGQVWAQGSSSEKKGGGQEAISVVSSAGSSTAVQEEKAKPRPPAPGWETRGRMRIERDKDTDIKRVEFRDKKGKLVKRIRRGPGKDGSTIYNVMLDPPGQNIILDEMPGKRTKARMSVLRYVDGEGKEVWSANICCGRGWERFHISEDGSLVVLTDVGAGDSCGGLDTWAVADTCVGLRVLEASTGKELYRELHGSKSVISPKGNYVVYKAEEGYRLLNVKKRTVEDIPNPPCLDPAGVGEDGTVDISCGSTCPCRVYVRGRGYLLWEEYKKEK